MTRATEAGPDVSRPADRDGLGYPVSTTAARAARRPGWPRPARAREQTGRRSDDTGPGPASDSGRSAAMTRAIRRPTSRPACPSACSPRASARASTSIAPSATRRSGPATSRPSSAATTASCPAPSTRRASCATTRSTSGSTPTRCSLQWRRERGDPREPQAVIAVPRPIAAPRPGLTFSPSLVVFALLRRRRAGASVLSRRPAAALREATDDRRDATRRSRSSRSTSTRRPTRSRGTSMPGRDGHRSTTPGRDPYTATADADGRSGADRRPAPRPEPVRGQRGRPDTGKHVGETRSACSSPCRSSSSRRRR